jgi:hypothetical protein
MNDALLDEWLAALEPSVGTELYGFLHRAPLSTPLEGLVHPVAFIEDEGGATYVVRLVEARRAALKLSFECRRLELGVDTPLDGVGYFAAIATALAKAGIAANPFAGFHRDTLFVPADRAEHALHTLNRLRSDARARLGR